MIVVTSTYYDSIASVMPRVEELEPGTRTYAIYFVFPTEIEAAAARGLELIEYGLQENVINR